MKGKQSVAKMIMKRNEVIRNLSNIPSFKLNPHWKFAIDIDSAFYCKIFLGAGRFNTLSSAFHLISPFDPHWYCTECKSGLKFSHAEPVPKSIGVAFDRNSGWNETSEFRWNPNTGRAAAIEGERYLHTVLKDICTQFWKIFALHSPRVNISARNLFSPAVNSYQLHQNGCCTHFCHNENNLYKYNIGQIWIKVWHFREDNICCRE